MKKCTAKVLVMLRSDAKRKHGGDVGLLTKYASLLELKGYDVTVSSDLDVDVAGYSACLTANIDRPMEAAVIQRKCRDSNVPMLLYVLHHPRQGVIDYLNSGLTGKRGVLARLSFSSPVLYETMHAVLRVIRYPRLSNIKYFKFISTRCSQAYLLKNAHLLVSCESEIKAIRDNIGTIANPLSIVPHIFYGSNNDNGTVKTKKRVVCAARIEPRKNQYMVLKLAEQYPEFSFIFIGDTANLNDQYYKKFISAAYSLDNVTYSKSVSFDELKLLLAEADIFISASWFEVLSLIELEAYAAHCKLVVGKNSYLSEFVSDGVYYFDPASLQSLEEGFTKVVTSDIDHKMRNNVLNDEKLLSLNERSVVESLDNAISKVIM